MEYQDVIYFAETWGLVFLGTMFVVAIVYAFWPSNKQKFEQAAYLPLRDDDFKTPEANNE